jgi:hypothetical protein
MKFRILFALSLFTYFSVTAQQDTIIVESMVNFYKYNDKHIKNADAINFIVRVTNKSQNPLPDLGATNRSQCLNFYINDSLDNPLSLYNGAESAYGNKTIAPGETATFDSGGWILTKEAGIIHKYGEEFTVQWEYMGVKSKRIQVNLKYKTLLTLND